MNEQFYIDLKSVPTVFREADKIMEKRYPVPDKLKEPKEIPMPYIDSNPNVPGPIYVTKDWYFKKKKKQMINKAKEKRDVHIEMIQLLARRDMLRSKLGELDPGKKSDSKKIAAINIDLKDITAELEMLSWQYDIDIKELDKGTRVARFVGRVKRKTRKIVKKFKKFWNENKEFILNIGAVVISAIAPFMVKSLFSK